MSIKRNNQGFTLLEVVLVIFIFSLMTFIGVSLVYSNIPESRVLKEGENLKSKIFLAQQNANASLKGESYGAKFFSDRFIIFSGDSYVTAETEEEIFFPNGIEIDSINLENSSTEIVFTSGDFRPDTEGAVRVTDGDNRITIGINSEGLVYDY